MYRIRISKLYWLILLILPIMDSINGWVNNGGNGGGLSVGIVYRIIVLLFAILCIMKNGINYHDSAKYIIILFYLIVSIIIYKGEASSYLMLIFRLLLPIMIICSIETYVKKGILHDVFIESLFVCWCWIFPLTIIIPYFFGIGFRTYGAGAAGYKGFYYAQNDIGYILALLYLFMVFQLWEKVTLKKIIVIILLLFTNLLLGLKSNYMLIFAITLFYLIKMEHKNKGRTTKFLVFLCIILGTFIIYRAYNSELQYILSRWQYFYKEKSIISFLTSSRWDRIPSAFQWVQRMRGWAGYLFGVGLAYVEHTGLHTSIVIEMDFFDLFFQLGIIGIITIYGFYISLQKKYKSKGFYFWGFLLSMANSTLAGHVLESALSGMVFGLLCSGVFFRRTGKITNLNKNAGS